GRHDGPLRRSHRDDGRVGDAGRLARLPRGARAARHHGAGGGVGMSAPGTEGVNAVGLESTEVRPSGAQRRPNLLFLMTDQQRADTIVQGGPCLTPNLQALARQGADLRRCYAPNPICSPTRASIFTGLLPHAHGMTDVTHAVPPQRADLVPGVPFWTQRLKDAGYHTGYFGKWHVERSDRLEQFGIDEYQVELRQTGVVSHDGPLEPRITIDQPGYKQFLLAGVSDAPAADTREA